MLGDALTAMFRIADQIDDLEVQIDYVRKTSKDATLIQNLQSMMVERSQALNDAWDAWNLTLLKERLSMV